MDDLYKISFHYLHKTQTDSEALNILYYLRSILGRARELIGEGDGGFEHPDASETK